MNKLKESALNDATKGGGGDTFNASNDATDTITSTTGTITRSIDVYIYGAGAVTVLAIGVCVFFTCNKRSSCDLA